MTRIRPLAAALLLSASFVLLSGCQGAADRSGGQSRAFGSHIDFDDARNVDLGPYLNDGRLSFIVLGDTGHGNLGQYQVAAAIGTVCATIRCDFVVGTGDNIYNTGVTSVLDPQWVTKFEHPYRDLTLPFYQTLGNHDVGSTYRYDDGRGDVQVAYHYLEGRLSDKWQMPARYYTLLSPDARFLMLDTPILSYWGVEGADEAERAEQQTAWVRDELGRYETTWTFAVGHHHYLTNGLLGDAGEEEHSPHEGRHWKRFVEENLCDRVDMLLLGHDHTLQWLQERDGCGSTSFLVSGGGSYPKPLGEGRHPAYFEAGDTLGFFWLQTHGPRLEVRAYDGDAQLLYRLVVDKEP